MTNTARLRLTYICTDWVTTSAALVIFNLIRHMLKPETGTFTHYYMLPQVIGGQMLFPVMMLVIYWLSGYYNNPNERSRAQELLTTLGSALTGALVIFFLAVVNDLEFRRRVAIELVGILAILFFLLVYAGRSIITLSTVRSIHRRNRFKPVVMIGDDPESRNLAAKINGLPRGMGLKIVAFVNPDDNDPAKVCRTHGSDTVIVSPQLARSGSMPSLLSMLMPADLAVLVSPGIYEFHTAAGRIGNVTGEPLVDITRPRLSDSTANIKRVIDVAGASLALIILSPLLAALAIAVKRSSPGPVIYRQQRMGRRKREFTILKFRSMYADAEAASGPVLTQADDPRITSVGRFMRKYRLDELPQFWNVIRGEMSLVGPRPERRIFADQIAARVPVYSAIYQIRPGITSWGMVKYGYASTIDQMIERLRYDLIYLENISVATDLKILLHTVATVIGGRGK